MKLHNIMTMALAVAALIPTAANAQTAGQPAANPVSAAPRAAGDTVRLSREECVAIALQDNPTVKVANLEV